MRQCEYIDSDDNPCDKCPAIDTCDKTRHKEFIATITAAVIIIGVMSLIIIAVPAILVTMLIAFIYSII